MATKKKKREKRPTVTFDAGEEGMELLDALAAHVHGLSWEEKIIRGYGSFRAVTRSTLIRAALVALAEKEKVKIPRGFRAR